MKEKQRNEGKTYERRLLEGNHQKMNENKILIHKDLEHRNLLQAKSQNLEKQMNEMMSKRRIQITDLQKQEIEEKQEIRLLIRLHISIC